jgi:hypothetical protein
VTQGWVALLYMLLACVSYLLSLTIAIDETAEPPKLFGVKSSCSFDDERERAIVTWTDWRRAPEGLRDERNIYRCQRRR